ncbi:hypothetical protein [Paenibacillus apiarius]|uniref:hypothetical protein n=1 Tax=Paenibacillus apiarius TaxID=46240 RepID=UPI001980A14E|nr:hypothetical protein [Paenibacillus apiarius]MBN3526564.1 hypothetical protein [Paenibacillus apiarius]
MSADDTVKGAAKTSDADIAALGTNREEITKFYDEMFARYEPVTAGGNYWMTLKHNKHMSFSDMYLISPVFVRMEGVDVRSVHRLINEYSLDFFNHYLKQKPFEKIEQNIGEHPEFTLERG